VIRTFVFLLAVATAHSETLDAVLARMDASAKTSNSFASNVKWDDYTKVLDSTDVFTGTIKMKRTPKGGVVGHMDIDKPPAAAKIYIFTGSGIEQYSPKANLVEEWHSDAISKSINQYLLLVFGTTGADIRKNFDAKAGGEETVMGTKTTRLELVPKDKKARDLASKIEMWVPTGQTYAVQVKTTAPNGDTRTWEYQDAKLNPGLPDSAYVFTPPAGARREVHK
jgi:outer membrane lipoprotein-sorting protein